MSATLFICAANVWRSQIAEGYYKSLFAKSGCSSAALIEDRREKYGRSPSPEIVEIMKKDGVDVSNQAVKLLDKRLCDDAGRIILLLDPEGMESEFAIEGRDAVDFLMNEYGEKVSIMPIQDPFWTDSTDMGSIRDQIKNLVYGLR